MSVLNHLGQVAAVILLLEVFVVVLIFLGIAGGLAFGLHWTRGKVSWASDKANTYVAMGRRYLRVGTDTVAKPFIAGTAFFDTVRTAAVSLRHMVQSRHRPRGRPETGDGSIAARPIARPSTEDAEAAVPLV